jgi:hypothetical protein
MTADFHDSSDYDISKVGMCEFELISSYPPPNHLH